MTGRVFRQSRMGDRCCALTGQPGCYFFNFPVPGTSVSTSWVRIAAALGPNVVGLVLARYSLSAVFAVFATVGLIGLVIAAAFTEETKNRVLEEISP